MPNIVCGTMFFFELSVKVIKTAEVLLRCVFSASVKFLDKARLIGMIEERIGIKMPIKSA